MANDIGYVDNTAQDAHYEMLDAINTLATANGWTQQRYDTSGDNHELILMGEGLTGSEEIYVGFQTYQDSDADYYNILAATMTGYVAGNDFAAQPGIMTSGVPAHNQRIDYWLTVNAQRIALAMKVGTPVYESLYVGKFNPYARPAQYPYPVVCAGMLSGAATTRFSDSSHVMPYRGNRANMRMRNLDGTWEQVRCYPFSNDQDVLAGDTNALRDTGGYYHLMPVELFEADTNLFGALDGIYYVSGFNNTVENTVTISGEDYIVIQDVWRTGFNDYYAIRMDA